MSLRRATAGCRSARVESWNRGASRRGQSSSRSSSSRRSWRAEGAVAAAGASGRAFHVPRRRLQRIATPPTSTMPPSPTPYGKQPGEAIEAAIDRLGQHFLASPLLDEELDDLVAASPARNMPRELLAHVGRHGARALANLLASASAAHADEVTLQVLLELRLRDEDHRLRLFDVLSRNAARHQAPGQ